MDPKDQAMAFGILVLGAAGSGKSAYAEQLCVDSARKLRAGSLYLATMPSGGEDARRRIERHRKLREGKGFETLELPRLLFGTDEDMLLRAQGEAVLLECVGTLVANELFAEEGEASCRRCAEMDDARLRAVLGDAAWREWLRAVSTMDGRCVSCLKRCLAGIASWLEASGEMVLVTNDVFADDGAYDKETLAYRAVLGAANRVLARRCAWVVEVVCGIPVAVKGGLR